MADVIPNSYILMTDTTQYSTRVSYILDKLVTPTIFEFRQIIINYEQGTNVGGGRFRFQYQNWNSEFGVELFLNEGQEMFNSDNCTVDYSMGNITVSPSSGINIQLGDSLIATYCFDYFSSYVLYGFVLRALSIINTGGVGTMTSYTIDNAPEQWDGVISDLVVAMCMEKLILDYDLWKGRLVFAVGGQQALEGDSNITSQLETIKRNCEERAYKVMDNPKFKAPNYLAKPTAYYYNSLLYGGLTRSGGSGMTGDYGKLRGIHFNRIYGTGMTGAGDATALM